MTANIAQEWHIRTKGSKQEKISSCKLWAACSRCEPANAGTYKVLSPLANLYKNKVLWNHTILPIEDIRQFDHRMPDYEDPVILTAFGAAVVIISN